MEVLSVNISDYINEGKLQIEKLVNDFSPYVYKIIDNLVHDNLNIEDKEEIISDVFFIIWKNQEEINNLKLYISGVTKNVVYERLRKNKKINLIYEDLEKNYEEYNRIERFEDRIITNLSINQINLLKPIEKDILFLYYYDSYSIKEVADKLKLKESFVKTKLFRLRKKMKQYLRKERDLND